MGNTDGHQWRVSRSASTHPTGSTTAGAISISDESSVGSPLPRMTLGLHRDVGNDQAASSGQVATRRGEGSSVSQNEPSIVPLRASSQSGVKPTGRSKSPGGHARSQRNPPRKGGGKGRSIFKNVSSEDVEHLEGRATALRGRARQEEDSMHRYREEMVAAATLIATQRRELQARILEQQDVRDHPERASPLKQGAVVRTTGGGSPYRSITSRGWAAAGTHTGKSCQRGVAAH